MAFFYNSLFRVRSIHSQIEDAGKRGSVFLTVCFPTPPLSNIAISLAWGVLIVGRMRWSMRQEWGRNVGLGGEGGGE
eukprot:9476716-Pyramimonas_sp.AAC.1